MRPWPASKFSRSYWSAGRVHRSVIRKRREALVFHYRQLFVKQDLPPDQRHQRRQLAPDALGRAIDPFPIGFSHEFRFALGLDRQWRHVRRGTWNDTCFAEKERFPDSVVISTAFQVSIQFLPEWRRWSRLYKKCERMGSYSEEAESGRRF
jgi:hypothetical protein